MTSGAFDFLIKPVDMAHLWTGVRTAFELWKIGRAHGGGGADSAMKARIARRSPFIMTTPKRRLCAGWYSRTKDTCAHCR